MDFATRQQVEGYAALVSASGQGAVAGTTDPLKADARGQAPSAWTREWWLPPDGAAADVVWQTAPVPQPVDTTFTFIGASANLPENLFPANQATLYVDGTRALTFDLGLRAGRVWQEGDFALEFAPRLVHATGESYHRAHPVGVGGFYRLAVPARCLKAGQPVTLRVVLEPPRSDAIQWFALSQRPDALEVSPRTNAEQIAQLQAEVIHLKRVVGNLARRSYRALFPEYLDSEEVIIYQDGRRHVHDTDVVLLLNGDLLAVFREASEHLSPDGKIVTVRSRDGGRTWGERQVLREYPGVDEREANLAQLRDGTVLCSAWPNTHYNEEGRYNIGAAPRVFPGRAPGIYVGRSTDNGYTWMWPAQPMDPTPFTNLATSERIVELDSGRLLMPVYFWPQGASYYGDAVFCSDDKGQTWPYLATMADIPGLYLGEPALIQTQSGRLISLIRHDRGPVYYQTVSDDRGETWTPAQPTVIPCDGERGWGNPASLVVLDDGTVLCVYGARYDPAGLYVVASYDDGATWDMAHRRVLRDDFVNHDDCYPSTVVMPDGRLFVAYYYNLFERFVIAGSFFRW